MITTKDHKGNIINQRALTYTPDGQIKSVKDNDKLIATYQYNHLRQRISKTIYQKDNQTNQTKEETTKYLWDKGLLSAEIKDNKITRRYVYLDIMPVAILDYTYNQKGKLDKTEVYSIHTDHLGTPKAITNDKQETVWSIEMDIFGETQPIDSKDDFTFNLRFAGQYFDQESGYHYNYHRYYDPQTGRYLTSDPIGINGGSLNTYAYVNNESWGLVDPSGLYTVYWGGAGIGNVPPYVIDQVKQLRNMGIQNVRFSTKGGYSSNLSKVNKETNMGMDAATVGAYRYRVRDIYFDDNPELMKTCTSQQTNYIGYSFGSLLASHTTIHYADLGITIDNLVLIGSPIGSDFLKKLQNHKNIKNVIVRDLTAYGDPIYAGMSEMELGKSIPKLLEQINGNGIGHFYYSTNGKEGRSRRYHFALDMKNSGLK